MDIFGGLRRHLEGGTRDPVGPDKKWEIFFVFSPPRLLFLLRCGLWGVKAVLSAERSVSSAIFDVGCAMTGQRTGRSPKSGGNQVSQ